MHTRKPSLLVVICLLVPVACGGKSKIRTEIDPHEAQARQELPVQAEVMPLSIPRDPGLPTWLLVVEPFVQGASGITAGGGANGGLMVMTPSGVPMGLPAWGGGGANIDPGQQVGYGISAQLISALQRVGNVVLIDYAIYQRDPQKIVSGLKANEFGPYLVHGTVTQYNQTTEAGTQGESSSGLGWNFVPYAGGLIAAGKGSKSVQRTVYKGMVAFDAQIIDPESGRQTSSFTAEGTFTSIDTTTVRTKWGKTKISHTGFSSAIGQATLAAMNKAIVEIHGALSRQTQVASTPVGPATP